MNDERFASVGRGHRRMWKPFARGAAVLLLAAAIFSECSEPTNPGVASGNLPPRTRLANVPLNDSLAHYPSKTPAVALYWIGDDVDGYVTAFQYRWSSKVQGVPTYHDWTT